MVKKSQDMKLEVSKRIFNGVKPEGAGSPAKDAKKGNVTSASWQVILHHQKQLAEKYLEKRNLKRCILKLPYLGLKELTHMFINSLKGCYLQLK